MPKPKSKPNKEEESLKKSKAIPKKTTNNIGEESKEQSEAKNDQATVLAATSSSNDIGFSISDDVNKQENVLGQSTEQIEVIKYDEPILTSIVVERYEGEKEKGLFEGFGKAVYQGGNLYEGEFHLGMMSGKGKYTWQNERIIFEGDFLCNEITGSGIYTWFDLDFFGQTATYQGEVLKGKRHGVGVFKSARTSVIYSGEWNAGKRHGKGKMIFDDEGKSYYEGDWVNNKKFGWGIYHYASGNVYEGMWINDVRHGEGTMRWFDKNQVYTGQWENGVQNGLGEHSWYLARIDMTQYCLRNTYYGSFKNGKREGQGTFLYADGSKYEGTWKNNLKNGWGKYTSKDGTVFEGHFEDDKITDSPTYKQASLLAAEISKIKTRVPSAGTTLNLTAIKSIKDLEKLDFSLKLDVSSIIDDFDSEEKKTFEKIQAHKTVIRYLDLFKQVYRFYSQLGFDSSPDNTYVLNRMQFWRFLLDSKVHVNEQFFTLMEFDRFLNPNMNTNDLHCPYDKIIMREFYTYVVLTSYYLYKDEFKVLCNLKSGSGSILSWCIEKLIVDNLLPYSCNVQGKFYSDSRKTLSILSHMVKSYEIYRFLCNKKSMGDWSMTLRKLLSILSDLKLINGKMLTVKEVILIMTSDNPVVYDSDNSYNLELEITFLEFFEILIGCAIKSYDKRKVNKNASMKESQSNNSTDAKSDQDLNSGGPKNEYIKTIEPSDDNAQQNNNDSYEQVERATNNLDAEELDDMRNLELWNEQNNYFFLEHFFPAADLFINSTKLLNSSL